MRGFFFYNPHPEQYATQVSLKRRGNFHCKLNIIKVFISLKNQCFIYRNVFAKSSKIDYFLLNFKAFFNAYFRLYSPCLIT